MRNTKSLLTSRVLSWTGLGLKSCKISASSGHCRLGLMFLGKKGLRYAKKSNLSNMKHTITFIISYASLTNNSQALKKFKEDHGHLKIPRSHPYFGNWPNWQRTQYKLYLSGKNAKITDDRIKKLVEIGFLKPPPAGKGSS